LLNTNHRHIETKKLLIQEVEIMRFTILIILTAAVLLFFAGCDEGGGNQAVSPPIIEQPISQVSIEGGHNLLGLWDVTLDPDSMTAAVIPIRSADMHLNVTRYLELNCPDCLRIKNIQIPDDSTLTTDITLDHPFPPILSNSQCLM
jgi:hypothetical protein